MVGSSMSQRQMIFFFGGELPTNELRDCFRRLLLHTKDRRFRLLAAFISEATLVLKQELELLPRFQRDQLPQFESILHLPEYGNIQGGCLGAAVENVLLVLFQVGMFIGHHESKCLRLNSAASSSLVSGSSFGLLSAAAVATAETLPDLIQTGIDSLRVSFRLGLYIQDKSQKLESTQSSEVMQSWTHVVTSMSQESIEEELMKYNTQSGISNVSQVFISAVDTAFIEITGPPSQLEAAFEYSELLRYSDSIPLPIYHGFCHAPHVYNDQYLTEVITGILEGVQGSRRVNICLTSSQYGTPFECTTAPDLLRSICSELLTGTTILNKVTATIARHVVRNGVPTCTLHTFRTSHVIKSVSNSLHMAMAQHMTLEICDLVSWAFEDHGPRQPASMSDAKLAIVGMASGLPRGMNDSAYLRQCIQNGSNKVFQSSQERKNFRSPIEEMEKSAHPPHPGNSTSSDHLQSFDADFFSTSEEEAKATNFTNQLATVTVYQAMEMAGIVPESTMSSRAARIGTFFEEENIPWRAPNASANLATASGGGRSFTSALIAGCTALWAGDVDTVIAGSHDIFNDTVDQSGVYKASDPSDKSRSKVRRGEREGVCRAGGMGAVVIKRLQDAEADNDNVLAVILSVAMNPDSHIRAEVQEAQYYQVLRRAGVDSSDVSFVEMCGAGTRAGNAMELESSLRVLAPLAPRRVASQRLFLGGIQGDSEREGLAAGTSSLIKALLCFEHEKIFPQSGIKDRTKAAIYKDLERRKAVIVKEPTLWSRHGSQKRLAVVNSFAASGGIATLLLEDYVHHQINKPVRTNTHEVMVLSAHTLDSLRANLESMLSYLDKNPSTDIANLSYTLCARRIHHSLRVATTATSVTELQKFIKSSLNTELSDVHPANANQPSVIFTFTGEGSTYSGSPEFFAECAPFRGQVLQLDAIVKHLGFDSVVPVIDGSASAKYSSHPIVSQLTIVVLEIALAQYWAMMGIQPCAVIGHSLGEYSAMVVSNILSASDALFLVGNRAQLTIDHCIMGSYSMLSLRATPGEIETRLKDDLTTINITYEIACRNGTKNTVLGGLKSHIADIKRVLQAADYRCVELAMPFAYHTAQMDTVVDRFYNLACDTQFNLPRIPYISSLLAEVVMEGGIIDADYMRRQTRETVDFAGAINAAMRMEITTEQTVWIDIGPHPICGGFVKAAIPRSIVLSSCRRGEAISDTLTKSMTQLYIAGADLMWRDYFKTSKHDCRLLQLPTYSWCRQNAGK